MSCTCERCEQLRLGGPTDGALVWATRYAAENGLPLPVSKLGAGLWGNAYTTTNHRVVMKITADEQEYLTYVGRLFRLWRPDVLRQLVPCYGAVCLDRGPKGFLGVLWKARAERVGDHDVPVLPDVWDTETPENVGRLGRHWRAVDGSLREPYHDKWREAYYDRNH